jgi:sortase B
VRNTEPRKQTRKKGITWLLNLLVILCLLGALICGYLYFKDLNEVKEGEAEYEKLDQYVVETTPPAVQDEVEIVPEPWRIAIDFGTLLSENPDTRGWIYIPETPVSYPVVQGRDNDEYLYKSIYGNHSVCGSIFADYQNALVPRLADSNTVLYGHNMGGNRTSMFSSLLEYKEKSYYDAHSVLQFDTTAGTGTWTIFAAFNYDVSVKDDFSYIQTQFADEAAFDSFVSEAKSRTPYDTGVKVQYGDRVLTLSTCDRSYNGANGRYVVMAVLTGGTLQ